MSVYAEKLLSGPRGRRLFLEYAMLSDQDVRMAVFGLGRGVGVGRAGSRYVLLTATDGASATGTETGEQPEQHEPTAESLAASIRAVSAQHADPVSSVAPVDDVLLRLALRASVDSAMYWQEPDDEDVVAAIPEVRAALVAVAERVLTSAVAPTWSSPAARRQWAVEWRADARAAPRASATGLLAEWGEAIREEEQAAARERPGDPYASWSGSWWSKPMRLLVTRSRIDDALELIEDAFGADAATIIPITGAGRTYEIDSPAAWVELCRRFPLEVTASRRHDWFRVTGWAGRWLIPDWQRVAEQWDAVHLTTAGYLSSATTLIPIDDEYGSVIGGWEPDATVMLTDVAYEADEPRQQWRRPPDGDEWETCGSRPA